jgi:hypothetical protein
MAVAEPKTGQRLGLPTPEITSAISVRAPNRANASGKINPAEISNKSIFGRPRWCVLRFQLGKLAF